MEEKESVFTGKTVDEAIASGLEALQITLDEAEVTVLEEGKRRLIGSVKAKVRVIKRRSDAERAAEFIGGLMQILKISAECEVVSDEERIKIDIKTDEGARVIGKRGDVLDAIQCIAGAVANIGREEYRKVVVDCQNYRDQREKALTTLAAKVAEKAVQTGRKMILEPMNPYERRIIHSALSGREDVKTASEGKEPVRYVAIIPSNAKPYDRGVRFNDRDKFARSGRRGADKARGGKNDNHGDRRHGGDKGPFKPKSAAPKGKREIHFGTFLGNSGSQEAPREEKATDNTEE